MTAAKFLPHLQSWIPPDIAWVSSSAMFGLEVSASDPDVVEFVATGSLDVRILPSSIHASFQAAIAGNESLCGHLLSAVLDPKLLKLQGAQPAEKNTIQAHCHGVFCLPDSQALLVLVDWAAPSHSDGFYGWVSPALKAEADKLHISWLAENKKCEEQNRRRKDKIEQLSENHPDMRQALQTSVILRESPVPSKPRAMCLLQFLPKATTFTPPSAARSVALNRRATTAIAASGWLPSRDGGYEGILSLPVGGKRRTLLTWEPYQGLPAYPEVRWCVQRRLPRALCDPRVTRPGRPEFESVSRSIDDFTSIGHGIAADITDIVKALEEIQFDKSNQNDRIDESRKEVSEQGFEACAWFQPYHVWSEETWGIYIDARKLDNLALSLLDDSIDRHVQCPDSLAALLAFGLIYAHEYFHARVEATLSWMEINAGRPHHLRYKERVYDVLRETPEWLEEALANWSSWQWFQLPAIQEYLDRWRNGSEAFDRMVEALLDLAPPGYRDWRVGREHVTWRVFSTQLSSASPRLPSRGIALPLDSAMTGPLPYDLRPEDIPLRFVGQGDITDCLQVSPATFNVPSRRELEKVLRSCGYTVVRSSGKGSHQKWTGPDKRIFILPNRNPISNTVFRAFLRHRGIDKATYVCEVRPNL